MIEEHACGSRSRQTRLHCRSGRCESVQLSVGCMCVYLRINFHSFSLVHFQAGILVGDLIVGVAGQDTKWAKHEEVVQLIR